MASKKLVALRFSDEELSKIKEWQEKNDAASLSEAIRLLIEKGLKEETLDLKYLLKEFRNMEERTMKTFHKGTKAALGSSVALATLLPSMANVLAACYNVAAHVADFNELLIESDGSVERDLMILEEWRGNTSQDFFKFVSDAGGELSRTGAEQSYPIDARERFVRSKQIPPVPYVVQEVTNKSWIEKKLGEDFAEEWERARKDKIERDREIEYYKARGERPFDVLIDIWRKDEQHHKELEEALLFEAKTDIEMHYSGLVFDIDCPELWREPTQEEKEQEQQRLRDLLAQYGLSIKATNEILSKE